MKINLVIRKYIFRKLKFKWNIIREYGIMNNGDCILLLFIVTTIKWQKIIINYVNYLLIRKCTRRIC